MEERQEMAEVFGRLAYQTVGELSVKNGWKDGSAEKVALHTVVGGIMSQLGSRDFLSGASGAAVNELVQSELRITRTCISGAAR